VYYAKYHVWKTMIVRCLETNGFDPIIFLYIGIPIVLVSGIALVVVIFLRRKKNQDIF